MEEAAVSFLPLHQNLIGGIVGEPVIIETVKMIKGDAELICNLDQVQQFTDKGFRIIGDEDEKVEMDNQSIATDESIAEMPVEGPRSELSKAIDRQEAITIAVRHILDRNNPDELTGAGLPRIEIIAEEAGVDAVTAPERATAMESISK